MNIFIGFDYYGAGNIGDDLMMAGFLHAASRALPSEAVLTAIIPHDVESQKRRFPRISWHREEEGLREELISRSNAWIGVGDTPFQVSDGPWFLERLQRTALTCEKAGVPMFMIGTGAEREALEARDGFSAVVSRVEHITSRDKASRTVISLFAGPRDIAITPGADLANLALPGILADLPPAERTVELGVTLNARDHLTRADIRTAASVVREIPATGALFICNETRSARQYDHAIYWRHLAPRWWRKSGVHLFLPDYRRATLAELIAPYRSCQTIVSTRYHGLLTAAWAGCRVAAIGRNSKVEQLAEEMGVPCATRPLSAADLRRTIERACTVHPERLEDMRRRAESSSQTLLEQMLK